MREHIESIAATYNIDIKIAANIYKEGFIRARDTIDSTIALQIAKDLDDIIYNK